MDRERPIRNCGKKLGGVCERFRKVLVATKT
jgi:hypothetical protein